jgi:hypothetical protein
MWVFPIYDNMSKGIVFYIIGKHNLKIDSSTQVLREHVVK